MKKIIQLCFILVFALISFFAHAQTSISTNKSTKTQTTTTKKPADGRTKTGDRIDKTKKGPKGETVYTGSRGGKYYLDKKGNKIYIKD